MTRRARTTTNILLKCGPLALVVAGVIADASVSGQSQRRPAQPITDAGMTLVLGRPADRAITLSVLSATAVEAFVEYGTTTGRYSAQTEIGKGGAGEPFEIGIVSLQANTRYFYRLRHRRLGQSDFETGTEQTFMTARSPGSTFSFGVQGDSHPERAGRMFDAALYRRTMDLVATERPDFYFMLGDDFSISQLIARQMISQAAVDEVYARQRPFLGRMSGSTALFLVNGNHEQAARFRVDGTPNNPAVFAGRARPAGSFALGKGNRRALNRLIRSR